MDVKGLVAGACCAVALCGTAAEWSRVTADASALAPEQRFVAGLLTQRVEERTPPSDAAGAFRVAYRLDPSIPGENAVVTVTDGRAEIAAGIFRALVHGSGELLRAMRFGADRFLVADGVYRFEPKKELRMGYLSRHNDNWYHYATAEELCAYADDLVLAGLNAFNFQYYYPEVNVADATPDERRRFEDISKKLLAHIHALGCGFCENGGSNQVPLDSPEKYRGVPNSDPHRGNAGFNACPSKDGGTEYILKVREECLAKIDDLKIEYFNHWPFDEGGCECEKCRPWGGNAFPVLSEKLYRMNKKAHPEAKTMISTWVFHDDDFEGLWKYLETHDWVDYVLVDSHQDFPKYPLEHPIPRHIPIVTFPEISMWGRDPWGAYGATALPKRFERLFHQAESVTGGCMYYSEGLYEDLNKEVVTRLYVDPKAKAEDIVRSYAQLYFCGTDPDDLVRLCEIYEQNHLFPRRRNDPDFCGIGEDDKELGEYRIRAEEACRLVRKMDGEILKTLRSGWRFRLMYLRALIDREMFATRQAAPESARVCFDELVKTYHAEIQLGKWRKTHKKGCTCPHYEAAEIASVRSVEDGVCTVTDVGLKSNGVYFVDFTLKPEAESDIRCKMELPPPEKWNGEFWGTGNGGFAGIIPYFTDIAPEMHAVSVTTDLGTSRYAQGPLCNAVVPKAVLADYNWRATHLMTVYGKKIAKAFYGKMPMHSYFRGGSCGGRQGFSEAARFPEDYDGIIAAVPAAMLVPASAQFANLHRQTHDANRKPLVTREQLRILADAPIEYMKDREPKPYAGKMLSWPFLSEQDVEGFLSLAAKKDPALGAPDLQRRLKNIYMGASHNGKVLCHGMTPGAFLGSTKGRNYENIGSTFLEFRYRRLQRFAVATWEEFEDEFALHGPEVNTCSTDLRAFRDRGGKMIVTCGWEDQTTSASEIVSWYELLAKRLGGFEKAQEFCRLFPLPGHAHGGTKGRVSEALGYHHGHLNQLRKWVTTGQAPETYPHHWKAENLTFPIPPYPLMCYQDDAGNWKTKRYPEGLIRHPDESYFACDLKPWEAK